MKTFILMLIVVAAVVVGCSDEPGPTAAPLEPTAQVTNRIAVPMAVRQNLGITFAKVERRPVLQTLRLTGQFELRPEARREYRVMIPGRVNLQVKQFDRVEPGTVIFTLDSPQWRELQHDAVEAESLIKLAQAALDVAIAQKAEAEHTASFIRQRIANLGEAQVRKVELEAEMAALENQLPRLDTEIQAKRVEMQEASSHHRSRLKTLASLTGMSMDSLLEPVAAASQDTEPQPRWRTLERLEMAGEFSGLVDTIDVTSGGWVETGGLVLTVVDPEGIRFRAHALQADMARLRDGQHAQIVPPQGGSIDLQDAIDATLSVGFRASPDERTIPVYATPTGLLGWAKPGVSAFLEVFTGGTESAELAIPSSTVVQDGLMAVIFRRDPGNPDQVIRMEGDLGASDGRWIVVNSGVKEGDEIVLDGAYQLMLASSGSAQKGGHFHPDGTFHEGDH